MFLSGFAQILFCLFYAVSINNGTCCSIFWNLFSCKYDLLYGICSFTCNYFYIDSGIIKSNCKSQELAQMIALQDEEKERNDSRSEKRSKRWKA